MVFNRRAKVGRAVVLARRLRSATLFIKSQKVAAVRVSLFLRQTGAGYRWELQMFGEADQDNSVEQSLVVYPSPSGALEAGFQRFEAALLLLVA